ncbi:HIT domain-containing protein [Elizabethkingia argentiflava]|uniref:HIT domain-containing protein n=1 Tax=Elizabethkingia argenteiflava TaxID=2681556 RepID=A0A845PQS1_9FLAO|nr:HIT family protein [Elizabethkingia argenteiflava]NAW50184.1 HIT domain-containing protein [Elizabethkingia argenteiflava]
MPCIFCEIVDRKIPAEVIFENEFIISFLDIDPINEGHILIIPKAHCVDLDDLNEALIAQILKLAQRLVTLLKKIMKCKGYSIMHNGGGCNDIGHFHLHIFPRYEDDGFGWTCAPRLTSYDLVSMRQKIIHYLDLD